MNKLIEDRELFTIGNKTFDVSNISEDRKQKALIVFNNTISDITAKAEKDQVELGGTVEDHIDMTPFEKMIDKQGLFLLRQNMSVLMRRMSVFKAIIDYIKRYQLTIKYIKNSTPEEYEAWQDWIHLTITGKKKENTTLESEMMTIAMGFYKEAKEKHGLTVEECQKLLSTSLLEMGGTIKKLQATQNQ